MHELSIAESMMNVVLESAGANNASKVTRITIVVGNLSGVIPDSLLFCFDAVKNGTIANGAELVIEESYAKSHCHNCKNDFTVGRYDFACPNCGEIIFPLGGNDLYIKDIEVE